MRRTIHILTCMAAIMLFSVAAHAQIGLRIGSFPSGDGYVVGDTVSFPVIADSVLTGEGALSFQMRLTYNDAIMIPVVVDTAGTIIGDAGWTISSNISDPEVVTFAASGTTELSGSGDLVFVRFKLISQGTSFLGFDEDNTYFNEGSGGISVVFPASNAFVSIGPKPVISVNLPGGAVTVLGNTVQASVSSAVAPVTWSVTDPAKASVNSSGLITATGYGTVGIVAEDSRGVIDTTDLKILGFELSGADTTNFQGQEVALNISTTDLSSLGVQSGSFILNMPNSDSFSVMSVEKGPLLDSGSTVNYGLNGTALIVAFAQTSDVTGSGLLLSIIVKYSETETFAASATFSEVVMNESIEGRGSSFVFRATELPSLNVSSNTLQEYLVGDSLQFSVTNNTGPVEWSVSDTSLARIDDSGKLISEKGGTFRAQAEDSIGATGQSSEFTFYDVKVELPDTNLVHGDTLFYPVRISNTERAGASILSMEFTVTINEQNMDYIGFSSTGSLTDGWSFAENEIGTGQHKIVAGSATAVETSGDLFYLVLKTDTSVTTNQSSSVVINDLLLNEGSPNVLTNNGIISITLQTSNESDGELPTGIKLNQNYPNPFNPSSTISFGIPESGDVRLVVYNMIGQQVAVLVDKKMQAGWHAVQFDASGLSSGTYIYRIQVGTYTQTKKMMLIK